ncbi:cytochrome C oxidase subunit I [Azospirillum sp. TSO35-2]|nr:cytochrome C oxidase subunit I [Azospirillum sp. TSO35-2]
MPDHHIPLSDRLVVPHDIRIRRIDAHTLGESLALGWRDFLAAPTQLLFLSVIYPLVGLVAARAAYGGDLLPLFYPLVAGLAFVGPLAAVGVYELSRRREDGKPVSWVNALDVFHSRAIWSIAALGLLMLTLYVLWLGAAQIVYDHTLGRLQPDSVGAFAHLAITTPEGWQMIVLGNAVGLIFAMTALALSVVSFPMMLDREVDWIIAMQTSIRAVMANPGPMALWGVMVTALLVLGCLPAFVGLAVVMPVLGHATWHLYRRVVG